VRQAIEIAPSARTAAYVRRYDTIGPVALRADDRLQARLEALGLAVRAVAVAERPVTPAALAGVDLVVLSSTLYLPDVDPSVRELPAPIVTWGSIVAALAMSEGRRGTSFGVTDDHADVEIAGPGHPLAAGLAGRVVVCSGNCELSWAAPAAGAALIARLPVADGAPALFAYERGAPLAAGTAPARRVSLFFSDGTAARASDRALQLFDAAVTWCLEDVAR
jgi:hypothetical protein